MALDVLDSPVYFITFRTYGSWLPGDDRGFVDGDDNQFGEPYRDAAPGLEMDSRRRLAGGVVTLNAEMRRTVCASICRTAEAKGCTTFAVNVRSHHVHVVAFTETRPAQMVTMLKAWATRDLVRCDQIEVGAKVWSRGFSARRVITESGLASTIGYVLYQQGENLAGCVWPEPR